MSICPQCGSDELQELFDSSNALCIECGEVVEPIEDGEGESWCPDCGDLRPIVDGTCARCGCDVEEEY